MFDFENVEWCFENAEIVKKKKKSSNLIPPNSRYITTRTAGKSTKTQGVISVTIRCAIQDNLIKI